VVALELGCGAFGTARPADQGDVGEGHREAECDPAGPKRPAAPDFSWYVEQELFPDEAARSEQECGGELLPAPDAPAADILDDDALRAGCDRIAGQRPEPPSCRRACLVRGRAYLAAMRHRRAIALVDQILARARANRCDGTIEAAWAAMPAAERSAGVDWSGTLLTCLGLSAVPAGIRLHLDRRTEAPRRRFDPIMLDGDYLWAVTARVQLLPGGPLALLTAAPEDFGCGSGGWQIREELIPR
jgi:hypothetical protein